MRSWFVIVLLAISSCFNPNLEEGFPCSDERECPSGFECCSDDTCNRSCSGGNGGSCDASESCQSAAWQTCDCTCLDCSAALVCEAAGLLDEDLSLAECEEVASTGCEDLSWAAFDNNNTCSSAWDGECDDGGPGADFDVCSYGSDCGDCGLR